MATDDWFGSDKAIELGFVSYVIPAASASSNTKKEKEMKEKKVSVAEAFKMLGIALGITKDAKGLTITTSTGESLEVNRDGGEPQVGDEASPDGTHVLEDGRTIVVEGGKITDIREASVPKDEDESNALRNENDALKAQVAQMQSELDSLRALAKSEEENRILAAVEKAGGEAWLTKAAASKYVPAGRSNEGQGEKKMSMVEKRLAEARERNKKRFERK